MRAWCAGAVMAMGATAQAANITWDGGTGGTGTSWNDVVNWGGDITPGATDAIFFTATGLSAGKTLSLDASQAIFSLNINSYSNTPAFTIGSAADITAGYTLTLTNFYRGDNVGNTQNIAANVSLAGDSLWNIINGYSGSVSVTGAIGSASAVTLTKEGSNTLTLSGANTFTGGVRSVGGSLVLTGTNAYTGTTAATGGNVTLSFGAATQTDIVNSASTLELGGIRGGGSLTVNGRNLANVVNSQTFNGLTLKPGASSLSIVNGISSGKTLVALGAVTRNVGSTVNFTQPTVNTTIDALNGFTTSTANDTSGILGGWATVGAANWAANNGTNIVAYTAYTDDAWAAGNNTNVTASGTIASDSTTHSLRFNAAAANTLTLGGTNTITSGGILVTSAVGNNLTTITGGTLRGSSGGDLVIHQHNTSNSLTIASNIADNTTATALTKSGGGNVNLTGTLSHTGGTYVNAGTLTLVAGSTDPLVNTGAITVSGGTLSFGTGTTQAASGAVVLAGGTISGGTLTKSGANYDVRNGTISTRLAGSVGIDKTTSGTVTLSNTSANTFTGTTTITEGSVIGGAGGDVVSINGNLVVGSLSGGNAASYSNSGSNRGFNSARNVTVYSNGSVNFGSGAQTLGGTVTIIGGSITGSQIYQNVTVNMTGGSWSGTTYGNVNSFTTSASADTAVISAALQSSQATKTFSVADGAAATDVLLSGNIASGNVAKTGAGLMKMTGIIASSGATTVSGGTLRVSNTRALGFGGAQAATVGTTTVSGASTASILDIDGITVNEQITLNGGTNGASLINSNTAATATIGSGVAGIQFTNGTGFSAGTTVSFSGGGGGGAAGSVSLGLSTASITSISGGTGFAVGDIYNVTGGGGSGARITITSVSGGAITGYTVSTAGSGFTGAATGIGSKVSGSGNGTGATLTGNDTNFIIASLTLTDAGTGYASTPTASFSSGTGYVANPVISSVTLTGTNNSIGGAGDLIIDAAIGESASAAGFSKIGGGKVTLTGVNTYTGATTINGGSLIVNGSLAAASAVAVNSGGTLGGSGTVGGAVTVNSGGFLAPGNSPGVLTVGSLNLLEGSTTSLEIAGAAVRGTDFDGITVTGANGLTFGGTLNLSFSATLTNGDLLDLFSFTDSDTGNFTSVVSTGSYAGTWTSGSGVWTFTGNDQLLTFDLASGDLTVVASAVPEPSTFALIGGMIALAFACGRSRRRA